MKKSCVEAVLLSSELKFDVKGMILSLPLERLLALAARSIDISKSQHRTPLHCVDES
jgi:hypothetical protein